LILAATFKGHQGIVTNGETILDDIDELVYVLQAAV
jgi:hypothetical protein